MYCFLNLTLDVHLHPKLHFNFSNGQHWSVVCYQNSLEMLTLYVALYAHC